MKRLLAVIVLISASCFGQNLLFKTGFESNTTLDAVPSTSYSGAQSLWLSFHGTDSSTGYSWPLQPWTSSYTGVRAESASTSGTWSGNFNDYIDTNSSNAHSGGKSLFLQIQNYPNGICCAQQPVGLAGITKPIREFYERFWMKYPSSWATQVKNYNNYIADSVVYFKTASDYRVEPNIWTTPGNNFALHGHLVADPGGINATCPHYDLVTMQIQTSNGGCTNYPYADVDNNEYTIPVGQWFLVEFYVKRSPNPDGRVFFAIDGHVIGDYTGITMGPYTQEIQDFGFLQQYSSTYPLAKWIDDWEIWDAPPCSKLPCGTTTGSGGGTSYLPPPSPTNYGGAVGAVGVPFSYQIAATNSPTSFSVGSLPAGLSLNTTTGLISGTPTATGETSTLAQIRNNSGKFAQMLTFQINSGVQAPTIPYFWATPPTTTGGASTLHWIVLGAGNVSLSINQGVGTVTGLTGSKAVAPASATTYTITATNSGGSSTKSVTVAASSSASAPPNAPTGLTAVPH